MSESWRRWWSARNEREQRLLLVMFALLAALLIWLLVVRPLAGALDSAKARHAAAVDAVGIARARAAAAAPAADGARVPPGPLDAFVRRAATEAGFAEARVTAPGPGRAAVAIAAARPPAFFAWVRQLEAQGLVVDTLSARANPDRTLAVEVGFRARGARGG